MITLDHDSATQFALMLGAGMPSMDAITYFAEEGDQAEDLKFRHDRWMNSKLLQRAILQIQGRSWQDMTLEQRMRFAMDKHYSELAYYLYAHNYGDLQGNMKQKADTCRIALEGKLSGMAGKMDPLSRFWDDVLAGKVTIPTQSPKVIPVETGDDLTKGTTWSDTVSTSSCGTPDLVVNN